MINKSKITDQINIGPLDTQFEEILDVLITSINKEANLTFFGKIATEYQIKEHLRNRVLIDKAYQDLKPAKISKPLIVIGLPRSGTTFLFNLLSKDLKNRSPLFWEMMKPLPLVNRESFSERARILRSDTILFFKERFIPKLDDLHAIKATSPEECLLIKVFALQSIFYFYMANTPSYLEYLANSDTRMSYEWHFKFLSILESTHKPERWLLKDPSHLGNLEEILTYYPDACFIHIKRDPAETLASICSLTSQVRKGFSNEIDLAHLGQKTLDFWANSSNKNESQKLKISSDRYIEVSYNDLIEDPINLIKDIYTKFLIDLDEVTLERMQGHVDQGSKEAKIKHSYSLDDYGLDIKEVHNKLNF